MLKRLAALILCCLTFIPCFILAEEEVDTVTLTFLGDCTIGCEEKERGTGTSLYDVLQKNGYAYPFEKVLPILEKDDLTVANFESVLYDKKAGKIDKTYNFRGDTAWTEVLTLGSVEVANLANNHVGDYGKNGYLSTREALGNAGISIFGSTEYGSDVYICEIRGHKLGFVGVCISYWRAHQKEFDADFQALKDAGCDVIIASVHAGEEYAPLHNTKQNRVIDFCLKRGADIIVCHHPHVPQGIARTEDGASIVYSLGNFVFGGNKRVRCLQSFIASYELRFSGDEYLGSRLTILPVHMSGTENMNNYQPVLVGGEEAQAVMELIQADTEFTLEPYEEGTGAVQTFIPRVRTEE